VWELNFKGKDVVDSSGHISKLKLVGVVIKFEDLNNFGNNIEISLFLIGITQFGSLGINLSANVGGFESHVSPVFEGGQNAGVLSLLGNSMATECVWGIIGSLSERRLLISWVEGPWSFIEHVDVELFLVRKLVPDFHVSSMDSDDITDSVDEWEIFELTGINDKLRPSGSFGELGWVNDLHGADEHLVGFTCWGALDSFLVWERCINNDTIEVAWCAWGTGDLGEFGILVL
jgi:hypothetical protein